MTYRTEASERPGEPVCRRLLPPVQAAEGCGVPLEWIWYLNMTGELPTYHLPGGRRIDEVELARVLAAHPSKRR